MNAVKYTAMHLENPLIVQSDRTLLLDVHAPRADECRDALIPFAELEKSPEHVPNNAAFSLECGKRGVFAGGRG